MLKKGFAVKGLSGFKLEFTALPQGSALWPVCKVLNMHAWALVYLAWLPQAGDACGSGGIRSTLDQALGALPNFFLNEVEK